ncbi:MAG: RluA family pseudouridine synthase [Paludibacteraceae bacterium]|nr:RluA family pseudouridine synthase [Paludibacteraceae bacterium]
MKNYPNRSKSTTLRATAEAELMQFLLDKMGGMSRTSVKLMLSRRQVYVNEHIETQYNYSLKAGDTVRIQSGVAQQELQHPKLRLIYEDDYIIIVDKKEGLLTMATHRESQETTAYSILKSHLKKANPRAELYTVHRLDRETSGVLMFAKVKNIQQALQENWHQVVTLRLYCALVEGCPQPAENSITSWLTEHEKSLRVHSSPTDNGGQKTVTHYKVTKTNGAYSLLDVQLETGRKNQIRVHMAEIGHPVVGDKKYGKGLSSIKRIGLHARLLEFIHPVTRKKVRFESPIPKAFNALVNKNAH